ncbi:hypothetical protein QQF64_011460 [Cirrhinus molitorella]|uniref:Uncharacterized protein n=1 Tax=Cirrhinus molitorella TaxID=172907 RepID=A0ABR3LZB1_9TELE
MSLSVKQINQLSLGPRGAAFGSAGLCSVSGASGGELAGWGGGGGRGERSRRRIRESAKTKKGVRPGTWRSGGS